MKATVTTEHEFEGCFDGCPFCCEYGVMSPCSCSLTGEKLIGYSGASSAIPKGQKYPDWCPIAKKGGVWR